MAGRVMAAITAVTAKPKNNSKVSKAILRSVRHAIVMAHSSPKLLRSAKAELKPLMINFISLCQRLKHTRYRCNDRRTVGHQYLKIVDLPCD